MICWFFLFLHFHHKLGLFSFCLLPFVYIANKTFVFEKEFLNQVVPNVLALWMRSNMPCTSLQHTVFDIPRKTQIHISSVKVIVCYHCKSYDRNNYKDIANLSLWWLYTLCCCFLSFLVYLKKDHIFTIE